VLVAGLIGCTEAPWPPAPAASPSSLAEVSRHHSRLKAARPPSGANRPGRFKVTWGRIQHADYAVWQRKLKDSRLLETLADDLNQTFDIPADIQMSFTECEGEPNAFYDSEKKSISVCYELIDQMHDFFAQVPESEAQPPAKKKATATEGPFRKLSRPGGLGQAAEPGGKAAGGKAAAGGQQPAGGKKPAQMPAGVPADEVDAAVAGATVHTVYHELGHALVDLYQLPITGREEDAVDQLATFLLADGTEQGEQAALDAAEAFLIDADQVDEMAYSDEHALGQQRFYNIVCWVYGQDPEAHADLVGEEYLPEERAQGCQHEYEQLATSWTKLLQPHLRSAAK
jgi:hypothetical protein